MQQVTKRRAWTRNGRRTTAVAAGLVAIIAGVAVAFFLSTQNVEANTASGAEMLDAVVTKLPLSAADLYPTAQPDGGNQARASDFTLENPNGIDVSYVMSAACSNCTDPAAESQWNNLYIELKNEDGITIYKGRLADMTGERPKTATADAQAGMSKGTVSLGTVAATGVKSYETKVWLKDTGDFQQDNVDTLWTFTIDGKTDDALV